MTSEIGLRRSELPEGIPSSRIYAALVLLWCRQAGVNTVCIAPGSRSTPLTLCAHQMGFRIVSHFDERGLAFFALGMAKQLDEPVAVICTSGSAVANLIPASVEAFQTGVPLVFLTGDRPPELQGCGANQSIAQAELMSTCTLAHGTVPPFEPVRRLPELFEQIQHMLRHIPFGPIHINMMFREPFYPDSDPSQGMPVEFLAELSGLRFEPRPVWAEPDELISADLLLAAQKANRAVIVALDGCASAEASIRKLQRRLSALVVADIQSGLAGSGGVVEGMDAKLREPAFLEFLRGADFVLQLGSRPVSKPLSLWLASLPSGVLRVIAADKEPTCLGRNAIWHWRVPVEAALQWMASCGQEKLPSEPSMPMFESSGTPFAAEDNWTEIEWLQATQERLLQSGLEPQWFVGNSLPIRLVDTFSISRTPGNHSGWPVKANRGASGIDGLIATLAGIASASENPVLGLIGDLSALHDLNSLALLSRCTTPWVLVIVNNDGGGIFNWLPIPESEELRALYQTPHGCQFRDAAALFGLSYKTMKPSPEAVEALCEAMHSGKPMLIELTVNAECCYHRWQQRLTPKKSE